jgi:hypothetical protein
MHSLPSLQAEAIPNPDSQSRAAHARPAVNRPQTGPKPAPNRQPTYRPLRQWLGGLGYPRALGKAFKIND